jgi:adenylate cyclase
LSRPAVVETKPYFVAGRDWFKEGLRTPGPAWTRFYPFAGGRGLGITCTTRYTPPGDDKPSGVFNADLQIQPIAAFLSSLRVGRHGAVFLTDGTGRRLVSPTGAFAAAAAAALDAAASGGAAPVPGLPLQVRSGAGRYQVVYAPVPVGGNPGLDIAVVVALADITAGLVHQALAAGIIALAAVALSIVVGILLAGRIARPVAAIAGDLATVGAFKISRQPAPRSFVREIAELGQAVDGMKASLRSFGHYVPTDLVRSLLAAGSEAALGGETRRLSIFFSDVADFTSVSEDMAPNPLVAALGRYFALMTEAITAHGGTVDKFMGDGIMAFFNAPADLPDHPRQACLAALAAQAGLARLRRESGRGEPPFHTRIGLGLGEVLVGNIGTPERFAYTILGDEVNLASRLEGLNKVYGTAIMADETLAAEAGGFEWRRLDRVAVKGRHQGTLVCELLGERGTVAGDVLAAREIYERALEAYFAADFAAAAAGFDAAAARRPEDVAARTMAERAHALAADPPLDWTGIHIMHEK